jgi:hypothetical protein
MRLEEGNQMKVYPDDWRVRLVTALGVGICMTAAMVLGPVVGIEGLLPGGLAICVAIVVGGVLGQAIGRRLFLPSSVRTPDVPPEA